MLRSMTAFGRAEGDFPGRKITVEIKSVNNRFFDCSARVPRSLGFTEDLVKPFLSSLGISRGKVDVNVSVENDGVEATGISLDEDYAAAYIAALKTLRDKFGLADDMSVMKVAADRNIFTVEKPEQDAERDKAEVFSVLEEAAKLFIAAREAEGERIKADLCEKVEYIGKLVDKIEKISENDTENSKARIEQRLRKVIGDMGVSVDENRVITECAIYADKIAIDEELVRLRSHIKAFYEILDSREPAGRKLDFLMQEMNREINTIGSKCQNAEAAQTVVDVKCELEKIREQIQNIE